MITVRRLILTSIVFLVLFGFGSHDEKTIFVGKIENRIVSGDLAGNPNLEFGVSNILEEVLQDREYYLDPSSNLVLEVSILFFGKQQASAQLAIYSKNIDITNVIIEGTLYKNGKKVKSKVVKGQSKSISTSTLIIDQGGTFSQASVSTSLKKACIELIERLKL